ncbi:alpha/beta fold hydrolase [Streptomyces bungoensis]
METYNSDGLVFPVIDEGPRDAEAVILLHGFPEDASCWEGVAAELVNAGYRVLAPTQRGYAPKACPKRIRDYRLNRLSRDIVQLMEIAELKKAHVVGHDWGGGVAWCLADKYPERLSSLTVVSTPHPRALARTLLTSRQVLLSWYLLFFQIRRFPEWILTRWNGYIAQRWLQALGLDAGRARTYALRFVKNRNIFTGALNWYRALLLDISYGAKAGAISTATLYVWGTEDSAVSEKAAKLTANWVSGSYVFRPLSNATHWIPEQRSQELAGLILEHVQPDRSP